MTDNKLIVFLLIIIMIEVSDSTYMTLFAVCLGLAIVWCDVWSWHQKKEGKGHD